MSAVGFEPTPEDTYLHDDMCMCWGASSIIGEAYFCHYYRTFGGVPMEPAMDGKDGAFLCRDQKAALMAQHHDVTRNQSKS